MSRLACIVLVRIMGLYATIPWANRGYERLDFSTLVYSLAIFQGNYDQRSASKGKGDV